MNPRDAVRHLTPDTWDRANRHLVRKAIAEFSHERLLTPQPVADTGTGTGTETGAETETEAGTGGTFAIPSDDGTVQYHFAAQILALDHWQIDAESIARVRAEDSRALPLDAAEFCTELRSTLGLSDQVLPVYLEEISSTLASTAYKLSKPPMSAAEVARADFQRIESEMTEGHPTFVAGSGRIGFGVDDFRQYAPEAAHPVRLIWVAANRDHAAFSASADTDYESLIRAELGAELLGLFGAVMTGLGLDLDDYLLIPVHPWQWWNKLAVTFAGDIARQRLVCLGPGDDEYVPQQSIRTFFNATDPARHYVKTALSVLNMGFMRGLSAAYMEATPAINDWLAALIADDAVLKRTGLSVIRERAAVGYRHRQFEAATEKGSPYRKMLAALWRESPVPALEPGRRLATMASLLHVDRDGGSLAAALIEQSGLAPEAWLRRYLDAYLTPLLHCFYAYGLVFMPHGENVILVLDEVGAVERVVFKDIAEEIAVMDAAVPLPAGVERIRVDVPEDVRLLSIFTDVFDCFLRYLNAILAGRGVLDQEAFWATVAECVHAYQDSTPELAERFERFDLFAPRFALSCLNRLQLRNNQQMVDLADPAGALQLAGTLDNPLAGRRRLAG
ncbi:IucA/IucC family protein [Catenulispora pinisilvae]|uniref:IucA/IucC family protein n=1 Tax=Catenulispora pinisilvae TaxID=2705253 RepID=UPI001891D852|nr:IucA/IucC family siderophore biosynthesis protein [Catenulispora pinisilvae]